MLLDIPVQIRRSAKAAGACCRSWVESNRNQDTRTALAFVLHEWRTSCATIEDHMCPETEQGLRLIAKGSLRLNAHRLSIS
jgi:hypothetical protein